MANGRARNLASISSAKKAGGKGRGSALRLLLRIFTPRGGRRRRLPSAVWLTSLADPVPELASDGPVLLVEAFAIIGEFAYTHAVAADRPRFQEPVGIGECLPRRADDVADAVSEHLFG